MKCSIQRGEAELNGTFHLSPNENICSSARMKKHSLFVLYNTKIDPCHLTSGTHCTLSFSLLHQFHWYPIFKQSPGPAQSKIFNSESNKVCLRFTKYVQGKIFAFSQWYFLSRWTCKCNTQWFMTAEFGSHDRIWHRLRYDLRPDFVSNCTKKPSDYDLYSLFFLFMIFQGFRLSFWCEIHLKNAQSWDLKFPRSPAVSDCRQWHCILPYLRQSSYQLQLMH